MHCHVSETSYANYGPQATPAHEVYLHGPQTHLHGSVNLYDTKQFLIRITYLP